MIFHSLRFRLIVYFLILIVLPLMTVSYFTFRSATALIEDKVSESVSASLSLVEKSIESVLEQSRYAATPFLVDSARRDWLQRTIRIENYDDLSNVMQMLKDLSSIRTAGHSVYSISLYNPVNRLLLTSEKNIFLYPSEEVLHMERMIGDRPQGWYVDKWPASTYITSPVRYLTYPIPLEPSATGRTTLFIHVNENTIADYLKQVNRNDKGLQTLVLTADGRSLIQASEEGQGLLPVGFGERPAALEHLDRIVNEREGRFAAMLTGRPHLVVFHTSDATGFKYVTFVPREDWMKEIVLLRNEILLVGGIAVAAGLLIAYGFMRSIYNPMFRLLKAMRLSAGHADFTYQIREKRKDEFGILFEGFNIMIRNIQQLVKNLYHEKLLKQEFELKLMQSRMNPHFLYNTLNSIYSIAKLNGVREVTEMAYALSHFFRHSLKGDDWITVKEMIEHLDYYLQIQKIRYRDKFDVTIDVEDELMEQKVLKLLLQPLVENAIIHGLEMKNAKGHIGITGYRLEDNMVFAVSDDGLGMNEKRLEQIRKQLSAGGPSTEYFALSNVNQRIRHYYGEAYGLALYSQEGKGTTVEVVLPWTSGGGADV